MPPVIIKNPDLIDGLWFSQFVIITSIVASIIVLPWPWWLLASVLVIFMWRNHRQILNNQAYSLRLNPPNTWFLQRADELRSCQVTGFWHLSGLLWIRLESEQGVYYFIIMKKRVADGCYAQLLMAVNQHEQKTE